MYVNHANVWTEAPPDVGFFNIIREPIDHDESAFYYSVDPQARTKQEAEHSLAKQKADTKCGCYKMEYDECIRFRNKQPGCSVTFATETSHARPYGSSSSPGARRSRRGTAI